VKELDGLDDEAITGVEIATGVPMRYDMADGVASNKRTLD
jgi:bisphosphoglycerate-dependent phosphoglycerate mutase